MFAITGEGTAFDSSQPVPIDDVDGETILLMEVANSGVNWTEPGDYDLEELLQCTGRVKDCLKTHIEGRFHVSFADGEVWCLSDDTPMERIQPFLTLEGARQHSREDLLGEYRIKKWVSDGLDYHLEE